MRGYGWWWTGKEEGAGWKRDEDERPAHLRLSVADKDTLTYVRHSDSESHLR